MYAYVIPFSSMHCHTDKVRAKCFDVSMVFLRLWAALAAKAYISYGRPRRPAAASFLIHEEGLALYGFLIV
jgi:hypothetical protein